MLLVRQRFEIFRPFIFLCVHYQVAVRDKDCLVEQYKSGAILNKFPHNPILLGIKT